MGQAEQSPVGSSRQTTAKPAQGGSAATKPVGTSTPEFDTDMTGSGGSGATSGAAGADSGGAAGAKSMVEAKCGASDNPEKGIQGDVNSGTVNCGLTLLADVSGGGS